MRFPIIEAGSCRVVPFEARHFTDRYVAWLNDPEVVRYSEQRHRQHTRESCEGYIESFAESPDYLLAIEANDEELGHIGNIAVSIDVANGVADVSILVGEKRAWGKGYATRAWCAVIDELLVNHGIRKVTAGTMSTNKPMLRLMDRSGMSIEAVRERHFILDGDEVDMVLAGKFRIGGGWQVT